MSNGTDRSRHRVAIGLCGLALIVALGHAAEPLRTEAAGGGANLSVVRAASPNAARPHRHRHRHHHGAARPVPAPTTTTTTPAAVSTVPAPPAPPAIPTIPAPSSPPRHALIAPGAIGSFEYRGYAPLQDRPLKVWYAAPEGDLTTARVLIVMHGQSRTAEAYRDRWIDEARRAGALLVVPEFSEPLYPGSDAYNLGNVGIEPPARWSYSVIEPLFDDVRADTGNRSDGYLLYGHSAGAQFVHRFLLLVSGNRVQRAVSANAGWYTATEPGIDFPYGLRGAPTTDAGIRRALAARLTVLLGEDDTDTTDPELRHTSGAERQGPHRLARGHFFYEAGLLAARSLGSPFGWTLQTVPGAAHSNSSMVPAAARVLFG